MAETLEDASKEGRSTASQYSCRSAKSASTHGSVVVDPRNPFLELKDSMCGAVFTCNCTGARANVCYNLLPCRRQGHRSAPKAVMGCYYQMKNTDGKGKDGVLGTWKSAEVYLADEAQERHRLKQEVAAGLAQMSQAKQGSRRALTKSRKLLSVITRSSLRHPSILPIFLRKRQLPPPPPNPPVGEWSPC